MNEEKQMNEIICFFIVHSADHNFIFPLCFYSAGISTHSFQADRLLVQKIPAA